MTLVTNYGGRAASLTVPDKEENGNLVDVVVGYDSLSQYLTDGSFKERWLVAMAIR